MSTAKLAALESLVAMFPKVDYRIIISAVKESTSGASVEEIVDEVIDFLSDMSSTTSSEAGDTEVVDDEPLVRSLLSEAFKSSLAYLVLIP